MSQQRKEKQAARSTRGQPIALTENEALCLLAAACCGLARPGPGPMETEDVESMHELKSAAMKLAQSVGMTMEELHAFAAAAAGKPDPAVVALFQEQTP
jgi:hypothetical protein